VISWNLKRRHLTVSQRALLAIELKPMFAERAKERMVAGTNQYSPVAGLPHPSETAKSRDQAAAAVGVSGRTVQDAEYVKKHAPEMFEQVKAGKITVNKAKQEVKERTEENQKQSAEDFKVTAQSIADKAIFFLSQIKPRMNGKKEALESVVLWCKKEIKRAK
jgi:hypothetical protein